MRKNLFKLKPFQSPEVAMKKLMKSVTSSSLPKNTARNVFTGNFSGIVNNFNTKKFGGKKDFDFDGIFNLSDCSPLNTMRQDFTPFRYGGKAELLTAAKRFGGKNIGKLQRIGQGRDRTVYALDKDKVLKVAKNPGGLTQNTMESALDYPTGQIKHYETGMDYVVMERAQPSGKATTKMLRSLKKAKDESYSQNEHKQRADFFNSPHFEASGLDASDFSSHSVIPGEFAAKRQWGEKDGQPVLIDGGALMDGPDLRRHRVKDFQQVANIDTSKAPPWQLEEWQEVQRQRRQYRHKGKDKIKHPKIINIPIEKAWDYRKAQAYPGDMSPKRTDTTMNKLRKGMSAGRFDPIEATTQDLEEGRLQEGKHRLIVAKELGMKTVPIKIQKEKSSYNDDIMINKFSTPGGKLEITEYDDGTGAVSNLYVDEDYRKQGIATNLLNEAKGKYKKVHAQVSNIPSVKTHFKAGFRLDDKPYATEGETIEAFKIAETGPGSIGMQYEKGASNNKQKEWALLSDTDKQIARNNKEDTDGDRVPDEYDCEPDNTMRQDKVYHGTTPIAAMKIKKQGILTSDELKKAGEPYHTLSNKTRPDKTYFFKDKTRAETWAEVATSNSMFPNAKPTVVVADIPKEDLFPDVEMEMGGAFFKEGPVLASQILNTYTVERKSSVEDMKKIQSQIKPEATEPLLISKEGRKQMTLTNGKPAFDAYGNPVYEGDL